MPEHEQLTNIICTSVNCRPAASLELFTRPGGLRPGIDQPRIQLYSPGSRYIRNPTLPPNVLYLDSGQCPKNSGQCPGNHTCPSWADSVGTGVLIGLSHCRHYLPDGVIKVLMSALVLTRIRYCLAVYGNGTLKNFDRLQRVLNFAVRVIFGRRKFDHVSDLREQLRWMSPQQMSQAQTLSLAHKVLRLGEPDSLADSFIRCRDVRQRSTRQDSLLHLPRPRTEAGRRRFAYRAPALYNSLPAGITDMSRRCFDRAVSTHLTNPSAQVRRWEWVACACVHLRVCLWAWYLYNFYLHVGIP